MLCIAILPAAVGEYNIMKAGRLSYRFTRGKYHFPGKARKVTFAHRYCKHRILQPKSLTDFFRTAQKEGGAKFALPYSL